MEIGQILLAIIGAIIYFWLNTRSQNRKSQPQEVVSPYPAQEEPKPEPKKEKPKLPSITIDEVLEEYAVEEIKKNSKVEARHDLLQITELPSEIKPREVMDTKMELDNAEKAEAYVQKAKVKSPIVKVLTDPKSLRDVLIAKELLDKYDFDKKFNNY